jgi:hypothetical protein
MTINPAPPPLTPNNHWSLDRRVPIGVLLALAGNTLFFVWVGSSWQQEVRLRLDMLERADAERKPQEARLIRLEEKLLAVSQVLDRIDQRLQGSNP